MLDDGQTMSSAPGPNRLVLMEALVEAALAAQRQGRLAELVRQRPRLARWVLKPHLAALRGSAGDLLAGDAATATAAAWLLQWAVSQLRPDREPHFDHIPREAWLQQTSWRPMLAVACHNGWLPVQAFPERYHRRPDEPPLDNLCGLWGVGPSTVYRYLDKGRRMLAHTLGGAPDLVRRLSLRRWVLGPVVQAHPQPAQRRAWHARQCAAALAGADALSALWHAWQGGDLDEAITLLAAQAQPLAAQPETDALAERLAAAGLAPHQTLRLWLARAALARMRHAGEREWQALEHALRLAQAGADRVALGEVYGALGKYHEPRDADRAFACYEDSARYLADADPADATAQGLYLTTLVRLAWLYVLRNDPRGRAVLDQAEAQRQGAALNDQLLGQLDQAWGEYWRRAGDVGQALRHAHRALNTFERLGDRRSLAATHNNLCLLYNEARDFQRALQHGQQVLQQGQAEQVDPEVLCSVRLNLGATCFWLHQLGEAIAHYTAALDQALATQMHLNVNRAHYNLAEAYYKRFQQARDPEDERLGDAHTAAALKASATATNPVLLEATRTLKAEILGAAAATATDRLLPEESAVHFEAMAEIGRQRAVLAVPVAPQAHLRARLAIAQAYLGIAMKEREAALALAQRHGLAEAIAGELAGLRATFERELSREEQLDALWAQAAADLLDAPRRQQVVRHVLQHGSINKSGYAQLCGVALATASKHLVLLAGRGLLEQTGKGPATRYLNKA